MDADRWRQISRPYHAVSARPAGEEHAFLDVACGADGTLRREVELLAESTRADAFFAAPAAEAFADLVNHRAEIQVAGSGMTLSGCRIERLLGRGGMGTVFLAHDTTLHRPVALKVVDQPADNESSRSRLLREARNAAAWNHPNICTVYEVGEANGSAFIAMEPFEPLRSTPRFQALLRKMNLPM